MKRQFSNHRKHAVLLVGGLLLASGCRVRTQPQEDPCDPNPCTEENRTSCVNNDGEPRCICNPGFIARPTGACEPVSAQNCPEHAGDAQEPDDCIASAKELLPSDEVREQTIEPTGDYDFVTFTAAASHVYQVSVDAGGSLYPRIDLYDEAGIWRSVAELTPSADPLNPIDLRKPRLHFKHPGSTSARYFVRVAHSPLDPSYASGGYAIQVKDMGFDDHGDGPATATSTVATYVADAAPGVGGRFEYPNDQDWLRFEADSTREYMLLFDTTLDRPGFALYKQGATDGEPLLNRLEWENYFTVPTTGTYLIQLYDAEGIGGAYRFGLYWQNP